MLLPMLPVARLDASDIVWTTPSVDAAGSMPIGNGEVVLNVWVEDKTGDLVFLIARTDALSEISRFLKLGRIRVHLSEGLLSGSDFKQHLSLHNGTINISGGGVTLQLFVDADANVIHLIGKSKRPTKVKATLESWRNKPRTLPKEEQGSAWSMHDAPFPLEESADVVRTSGESKLEWYHRNETSVVPKLWENQSLTNLPGRFDPILHRTFGGLIKGEGFTAKANTLASGPRTSFSLSIATVSAQTKTVDEWSTLVEREAHKSVASAALKRTNKWWNDFWQRSWVFVDGDSSASPIPQNDFPLRMGVDSNGENVFPGEILNPKASTQKGLDLSATITLRKLAPGRIFDKLTAGQSDGFLFDTYPGDGLRLIVGDFILVAPKCLEVGKQVAVRATYSETTGEASIVVDGVRVAHRAAENGSPITRGYLLQRYVQACQGRGTYPIKFNGGYYSVEPKAMGKPFNPDFRNWGDAHWWQNVRHMYHPMIAQGDTEMMEPLFRMYESVRPLAEARTKAYHKAEGAYFPETMSVFGTYSGGDYGWDRTGHEPKDVLCPWWQFAWNQGPELVALMLDRWDSTRDKEFLQKHVLPMADSVLQYFDTRFSKTKDGKIVLDPTQVVETYWQGVTNDMPTTAGLIAVTERLNALPSELMTAEQRIFYWRMGNACPALPLEDAKGVRQLAPAAAYKPEVSNVENGELYAVWPFRLVSLSKPALIAEAKTAYANRKNHLDVGWGYDGNVAALLGMTDEAARILSVKCANSRPEYRWPATWGPNFDWLPDQNHGGNLLNTTNLMLLQSDSIEDGGAIRLLPAWPKKWDVDFKLHASGNTVVHCRTKGGKIVELEVVPGSRRKDVVLPAGWVTQG